MYLASFFVSMMAHLFIIGLCTFIREEVRIPIRDHVDLEQLYIRSGDFILLFWYFITCSVSQFFLFTY